jgi:DNA adenine methylase
MESIKFYEVNPVSPVAPYVGGKKNLAKTIISRIEKIPHILYAEPFVGMGGVFLRRRLAPRSEVINDVSGDVINFFRVLQKHYPYFMDMMKFQLASRKEFERLLKVKPETLTDLEKAARFLYLQRTAFGGKITDKHFGITTSRGSRFDITKLGPMLDDLHSRLSGVVIECLPYQDFIPRYDRAETLFYLDPPYYNCEDYYGKNVFNKADFERLAEILSGIKGRFIMSLNDVPEVRHIFKGFEISSVDCRYTLCGSPKSSVFKEVIIEGGGKNAKAV